MKILNVIVLLLILPLTLFANTQYCRFTVNLAPSAATQVSGGTVGNLLIPMCQVWLGLSHDPVTLQTCQGHATDRLFINPIEAPQATCLSVLHQPVLVNLNHGGSCRAKRSLSSINESLVLRYPQDFDC